MITDSLLRRLLVCGPDEAVEFSDPVFIQTGRGHEVTADELTEVNAFRQSESGRELRSRARPGGDGWAAVRDEQAIPAFRAWQARAKD